jgi:hypothetical protein
MTIRRSLAAVLAAAALIAPAAQAQPADMHASTAIAAAKAREAQQPKQDLRSPDARHAALLADRKAAPKPAIVQDLRSPDAVDAAEHRGLYASEPDAYVLNRDYGSPDAADRAPAGDPRSYVLNRDYGSPDAADAARDLPPVQIPVVEARNAPSSGFDWGDAGIGAAGMLALFSIAGGAALLLTGRRRGHGIA